MVYVCACIGTGQGCCQCELTAPFLDEVGVGARRWESAPGASRVETLNVKEISSNCSVSRPHQRPSPLQSK